jgi:hypothetical protein
MNSSPKPLFTIEMDLEQVRLNLKKREEKSVPLKQDSLRDQVVAELATFLNESESLTDAEDRAFAEKLAEAKSCTVVYYSCGTCKIGKREGALREFFCDGGGSGSSPDYKRCDPC